MKKIIVYNSEKKKWQPFRGLFSAEEQKMWIERIFAAGGFAFACPREHVDLYTGKRAREVKADNNEG